MSGKLTFTTLREDVATLLRSKILRGEIKPGEKINEVEISKEFAISRGPVREALRQIEQEGLITYRPNKGCTVKTLSPEEMSELYLIRSTLEALAIRVYSADMGGESLNELYRVCGEIEVAAKEGNLAAIVSLDQEFHSIIVREAGLEALYKTWKSFDGSNVATYFTMQSQGLVPTDFVAHNHRIIADALNEKDLDKSIHMIQTHYMVVPRELYKHNKLPGAKILNVYGVDG